MTKEELKEFRRARDTKRKNEWRKKYLAKKPWMSIFQGARCRCNGTNRHYQRHYGKKGIKFLMTEADIEKLWYRDNASSLSHPSIDRIDSDGNYEYSNCRFIELAENTRRANKNRGGEEHPMAKLKKDDVLEMRRLHSTGKYAVILLAKMFKVSPSHARSIIRNDKWKSILQLSNQGDGSK